MLKVLENNKNSNLYKLKKILTKLQTYFQKKTIKIVTFSKNIRYNNINN